MASDDMTPADAGEVFELQCFRHFLPLLVACRDYARFSGCRFVLRPFEDLEGQELPAILHAAPAVSEFANRLRSGEKRLLKELRQAFRIAMLEGIRNAMISTCKELGVFPPLKIPSWDCSSGDSVPFLVIAQRLYNDEAQRQGWLNSEDQLTQRSQAARHALTAMFLVDFATEVGVPLPTMRDEDTELLQEFSARAAEWAASQKMDAARWAQAERTLAELDVRRSTLYTCTGVASAAAIGLAASPVAAPAAVAANLILAVGTGIAAFGGRIKLGMSPFES
mmetsp:Transcript_97857/g.174282  ORF Transcript_97857/g.174282 Transcript_97857/m.174282 type:complete len:280 (+) Transcript_97857:45-884(+)|eukprot:CAMPEP_0197653264 /NCGR_PEP_ID=MMETSP1338-20131121/34949_1 /TAXON_ID=43686 ORGANISM="Pelagodinium beii, Strain RCC1491" /NCGR_SAMPLE_ID=MMETSP1338 /ASSEMBLY_ACC=CAM_ASM_000754 /LENGTH=279 /DNA_ID=CAMNT_0043228305 /DNA_START=14 /DNA_END=853 /DNA_ORIENTATION=+